MTQRIQLEPFTLSECSDFFLDHGIEFNRRLVADSYMVFGGIPYYLDFFKPGLSVAQNVDTICFAQNAALKEEFEEMYASLFKHSQRHQDIVTALGTKNKGLTRDEIVAKTGFVSGGGLSTLLDELEQSGFIRCYREISGSGARQLYQLVDCFSLFHLKHMGKRNAQDEHYWSNAYGRGLYNSWSGHAFEILCLLHIPEIKDCLGILGVSTETRLWRNTSPGSKLQIDLVLDRNDGIINLCEMKYSIGEFEINKAYAEKLAQRRQMFIEQVRPKKAVHLVMITASGLKQNAHSHIVQSSVSLDGLWSRRR